MIRLLICLALLFAAPAMAFELPWAHAEEEDAPELPPRPVVTIVMADESSDRRSFPGVVQAGTEVQLGFQTLGILSSRRVDVGDMVETGDLLAALTPDDLQDNVRAAQAAVSNAEITLETAQASEQRVSDLAARNVASKAQLEEAQRALSAAEAGLAQARSELVRAEDAEGFAQLMAPFGGVVSAVFEEPGAVVDAGAPILTLSDVDSREAVIDLPEAALPSLPPGTPMTLRLESDPDSVSAAKITRIDPMADAATRTRRVHLSIEDPQRFRLGALVRAQQTRETGSILTLPDEALFEQDGAPAVWVVKRDGEEGRVHATEVSLGLQLDGVTEITAGLAPGDIVVVRGVHSLTEGQEVGRSVKP